MAIVKDIWGDFADVEAADDPVKGVPVVQLVAWEGNESVTLNLTAVNARRLAKALKRAARELGPASA